MIRTWWRRIVSAGLICASPALCKAVEPASAPPTTQPAFTAMAYYEQNCAHCHGPQGSFYGPTLGNKLSDAQLRKVVKDMAEGPGNAPLRPEEVDCETAYHRALIMRTPYVSVTSMARDQWSGEAMPGATVTLEVAGQKLNATMDDWNWTVAIPPGVEATAANAIISAVLDGKTTTLNPGKSAYSHTETLAPPGDRKP